MKEKLLAEIKALKIKEFDGLKSLNLLDGSYLNLEVALPSGIKAKLLADHKKYYANQVNIDGSEKCYGVAADESFIVVYRYGSEGKDAELVQIKRI